MMTKINGKPVRWFLFLKLAPNEPMINAALCGIVDRFKLLQMFVPHKVAFNHLLAVWVGSCVGQFQILIIYFLWAGKLLT